MNLLSQLLFGPNHSDVVSNLEMEKQGLHTEDNLTEQSPSFWERLGWNSNDEDQYYADLDRESAIVDGDGRAQSIHNGGLDEEYYCRYQTEQQYEEMSIEPSDIRIFGWKIN